MMQIFLVGAGAAATSALLFASISTASPLSFLLANFAQLPILIAAIGWTHFSGLVAVLLASAGLTLVFSGWIGFAFLIGIGLPAWWLGYLALLARPGAEPGTTEWYPVGRIVAWTAIVAAAVTIITMMRYGADAAQMQAGLRRELERAMRFFSGASAGGALRFPGVRDPERLIDILVLIVPPMKATALTATSLLNLWLAALIVKVSGGLRRPWPVIAQMSFPPFAPAALAAAIAATFVPDLIGLVAAVFAASLLFGYALLGFAVVHAITTGITGRGFMLAGLYFTVVLFGWPLVLMSFLGLLETIVALRARVASRRGPPGPPVNRV